jgi:hypothetical protein
MVSRKEKLIDKDFQKLKEVFPKLGLKTINQANDSWLISGEIDICDVAGNYWDTYEIKIRVPFSYPYCIISAQETSLKIVRSEDRHIDDLGICCLDISHKLLSMKMRGVNLLEFTKNKIYPFFANQVYFDQTGKYAAGDYPHRFDGIRQFYIEDLKIETDEEAIEILEFIFSKQKLSRNDKCFCGFKKFKDCHLNAVEFLSSVGINQLRIDLAGFKGELDSAA